VNRVLLPQGGTVFKGKEFERLLPNSLVGFAVVEIRLSIVHIPARTASIK
jgi:hypothetical protein